MCSYHQSLSSSQLHFCPYLHRKLPVNIIIPNPVLPIFSVPSQNATMTTLQVKGPRKGNSEAVSYHTTYLRSQGNSLMEFLVTIRLGSRLRNIHPAFSGKSLAMVRNHADSMREQDKLERNENGETHQKTDEARQNPSDSDPGNNLTDINDTSADIQTNNLQTNSKASGLRHDGQNGQNGTPPALWPAKSENPPIATPEIPPIPNKNQSDTESESELEILEVRQIPRKIASDSEDDDSELSSLDDELNNVLTSTITIPTQADIPQVSPVAKNIAWEKVLPTLYKRVEARTSPPPPGYRNIPPNLVNTIQRELNLFFDTGGDDELEVVGKLVFSLKDPYSATKIKLPVKATTCRHFECFDLENFCLFHKLPHGVRHSLKKSLIMKSHESRKLEQLFLKQQEQIEKGTLLFKSPGIIYPLFSEHGQMFFSEIYSRTPPLYKCPLCDEKFALKQLYISDIFNFFVKTTPLQTTRIELVEADRYKILEAEFTEQREETTETVELSEEDDEEEEEAVVLPKQEIDIASKSFNEDFNDGLDDVLMKMSQGDGSWGNPMTLD